MTPNATVRDATVQQEGPSAQMPESIRARLIAKLAALMSEAAMADDLEAVAPINAAIGRLLELVSLSASDSQRTR